MDIVVSNKASRPLYEQISTQIKAAIMSGELKTGEAIPSVRSLAKSLHISILTVQKAYATLQEDGFIESTAGKGCYVSAQNQDFYLEEQQKRLRIFPASSSCNKYFSYIIIPPCKVSNFGYHCLHGGALE